MAEGGVIGDEELDRFGVILDPNGISGQWYSQDSVNTHEKRQSRIKVFSEFLVSVGVKTNNYATVFNRE